MDYTTVTDYLPADPQYLQLLREFCAQHADSIARLLPEAWAGPYVVGDIADFAGGPEEKGA